MAVISGERCEDFPALPTTLTHCTTEVDHTLDQTLHHTLDHRGEQVLTRDWAVGLIELTNSRSDLQVVTCGQVLSIIDKV